MRSCGHRGRLQVCAARHHGFTLIEVVIVIALLAIAAGMALPSLREALLRNTATNTANDLIADLNTARAEAVKRGFRTAVIARSGGWTNGWDIRVDANGNGSYNDAADVLVRQHGAVADNFRLLGAPKSGAGTFVAFNGSGAAPGGDYDFAVCRPDSNNEQNRAVLVQRNGSVSSQRKPTGLAVSC